MALVHSAAEPMSSHVRLMQQQAWTELLCPLVHACLAEINAKTNMLGSIPGSFQAPPLQCEAPNRLCQFMIASQQQTFCTTLLHGLSFELIIGACRQLPP